MQFLGARPFADSLGVARFETLLALVELSGAIDEEHRKGLFELQQVRNVIVHRAGIVDRRLREQCPGSTWSLARNWN